MVMEKRKGKRKRDQFEILGRDVRGHDDLRTHEGTHDENAETSEHRAEAGARRPRTRRGQEFEA
jgi:hypothetical protein